MMKGKVVNGNLVDLMLPKKGCFPLSESEANGTEANSKDDPKVQITRSEKSDSRQHRKEKYVAITFVEMIHHFLLITQR